VVETSIQVGCCCVEDWEDVGSWIIERCCGFEAADEAWAVDGLFVLVDGSVVVDFGLFVVGFGLFVVDLEQFVAVDVLFVVVDG